MDGSPPVRVGFEELVNQSVRQLDPSQWDEHLRQTWGDLPSEFPEQAAAIREQFPAAADIRHLVAAGGIAFGPFCCWERET